MACARSTNPSAGGLSDSDLLAYLAGDADIAITAHLAECQECQQRAAQLAAAEQRLTAAFFRFDCPPPLVLGEYQLGLLSAADRRTIEAHLQLCPHCASEVADLLTYLTVIAPTIEPVSDLEATPPFLERVRVVVARLAAELSNVGTLGGLTSAAAGVRGTVGDQLVYTIEELGDAVQVIIDVQADAQNPTQRVMLGLLLGLPVPEVLTAHLWHANQPATTTPVDRLGNFVIAGLAPGTYDLILSGDKTEIHLQNLSI